MAACQSGRYSSKVHITARYLGRLSKSYTLHVTLLHFSPCFTPPSFFSLYFSPSSDPRLIHIHQLSFSPEERSNSEETHSHMCPQRHWGRLAVGNKGDSTHCRNFKWHSRTICTSYTLRLTFWISLVVAKTEDRLTSNKSSSQVLIFKVAGYKTKSHISIELPTFVCFSTTTDPTCLLSSEGLVQLGPCCFF